MQSTTRAPRRSVAALASGALVAGLTVGVGLAPAHADDSATGAELTWGISEQFVDHLSTRTLSDEVSFDEGSKTFTFPRLRTVNESDGTVVREYAGSVEGSFGFGGSTLYSVTVAEPEVVVEPDGAGMIRATVSASNAAAGGNDEASTEPTEVTVVEFSGAASPSAALSLTPAWEGVLATGSQAALGLGLDADQPLDGKAFHPEFLGALTPGVRAHFYASGSGSDAKKNPADVVAGAAPSVTATVTDASRKDGVTVRVEGTGFNPTTRPGDQGVYVGLAAADTVIDFDNQDSQSDFPAVDWVMPSRFDGDKFTAVLNAPTDKLVKGTDYAVFTWQAHRHSNTSQDTVTPVSIDWSKLAPKKVKRTKPAVRLRFAKKANTRRTGRAVVRVVGRNAKATGRVRVVVKRAGVKGKKVVTRKLNKKARVAVKLPKAKNRGRYVVRARYLGDKANLKNKKVKRYRVKR